jgi:hypothetical protein
VARARAATTVRSALRACGRAVALGMVALRFVAGGAIAVGRKNNFRGAVNRGNEVFFWRAVGRRLYRERGSLTRPPLGSQVSDLRRLASPLPKTPLPAKHRCPPRGGGFSRRKPAIAGAARRLKSPRRAVAWCIPLAAS